MIEKRLTRRKFLHRSAVASLAARINLKTSATDFAALAPTNAAEWFDRPMRWAQLTLVENDPGQYDPEFWLDYFKRCHADAACLSAGGCVAYYPTNTSLLLMGLC